MIFRGLHEIKSLSKSEFLFSVEATFVKKEQNVLEILMGSEAYFDSVLTNIGREATFLHLIGMISLIMFQNRLRLLLFLAKRFLLHFVFASRMEFVQRFRKIL